MDQVLLIVHPFSFDRPKDKKETWDFVTQLRAAGYAVIDREVHRQTYPDQLGEYWGEDDLIILEDDKVPTMEDFLELAACPHPACIFPYPSTSWVETTVDDWNKHRPYGLGFVKFSLEVQIEVPLSAWHRGFRNTQCDRIIEVPVIAKFGPMHIHQRLIKHVHGPYWRWWLLDLVKGH